jgi:hypothetical protein
MRPPRDPYAARLQKKAATRAGGCKCEVCGWEAPAAVRNWAWPSGERDLMTVHHIILLACGGAEAEENRVILCPNCHAVAHTIEPVYGGKQHFGSNNKAEFIAKMKAALFDPEAWEKIVAEAKRASHRLLGR